MSLERRLAGGTVAAMLTVGLAVWWLEGDGEPISVDRGPGRSIDDLRVERTTETKPREFPAAQTDARTSPARSERDGEGRDEPNREESPRLSGSVVDGMDSPLDDVRVLVLHEISSGAFELRAEAWTSRNGGYEFNVEPLPRGSVTILAQKNGFASDSVRWNRSRGDRTVDLRLADGAPIAGTVSIDRVGVDGVTVEATLQAAVESFDHERSRVSLFGRVTTDASGQFTLWVPKGIYRVSAMRAGYQRATVDHVVFGTRGVALSLVPVRSVGGLVVDSRGRPVIDATVRLFAVAPRSDSFERDEFSMEPRDLRVGAGSGSSNARERVRTKADGSFRFDAVDVSEFRVVVEAAGFVTQAVRGTATDAGETGETAALRIEMPEAASLEGEVRNSLGRPVQSAVVFVDAAPGAEPDVPLGTVSMHRPVETAVAEAATDPAGRFRIDSILPGWYSLSVKAKGHPVWRDPLVRVGDEATIDVELEDGSTLRGRVVTEPDDTPVGGARVTAWTLEGSLDAVTKIDGTFEINGLDDSVASEFVVAAPGYETAIFDRVDVDRSSDFVIEAATRLRGRVLDAARRPVTRATVVLSTSSRDQPVSSDSSTDRVRASIGFRGRVVAVTDVDGRFTFDRSPPGPRLSLRVTHPQHRELHREGIEVDRDDADGELELVLEPGGTVEVFVVDPGGDPVARAAVDLARVVDAEAGDRATERLGRSNLENGTVTTRWTGPDGRAAFFAVPGGSYRVRVEAEGFQVAYSTFDASDESTTSESIVLRSEHEIRGVVVDVDGVPIERAIVTAWPEALGAAGEHSRDRARSRSSWDGTFRLRRLGSAVHRVSVEAYGFAGHEVRSVRVDREIEIRLAPLASIVGTVVHRDTAEAISSFRLLVRTADTEASDYPLSARSRARLSDVPIDAASRPDATARPGVLRGEPFGGTRSGGGFSDDRRSGTGRWHRFFDGAFRIDGLEAGDYVVEVVARGYSGATVEVHVDEAEVVDDVDIVLEENISIRGYVKDLKTSDRLPNATLYLVRTRQGAEEIEDENERAARRWRDRTQGLAKEGREDRVGRESPREIAVRAAEWLAKVRTSARGQRVEDDGSFVFRDIADGDYRLIVEREGYLPVSREILVQEGVRAHYAVLMDAGESLRGRVRLGRRGTAGVTVVVESPDGIAQRARTDRRGRFFVSGFLPGAHTVRLSRGGETIAESLGVEIEDGRRNEFEYQQDDR